MSALHSLTASQMRKGLLNGSFCSLELTKAHLERIKNTNEIYNSFISLHEQSALEAAKRADKLIAEQKHRSALLTGIPAAVKDLLVTEGFETTAGSKILSGFVPPYNCTAVERLLSNGAVVLGKTNLDEFGMGSSNENSAFGPVLNPWDTERVPGGSSGGAAVAVSLGQSPISLATDTGGSIRQPASLSGIYGLKPTYGRVSRYGAIAFASSLDQIGPMARSVEDLALALQCIAGADANDSTSMEEPVPDYTEGIRHAKEHGLAGLRVGVPKEYFIEGLNQEIKGSIEYSLKVFERLGAEIVEITLPHTEHAVAVYYIISSAEASSNLARYDGVRYGYRTSDAANLTEMYLNTRAQGFGAEAKRRILIGTYVLSAGYYDAYYLKAQQVRTLIINDFKAAFHNDCDIIAAPVSPTTAFKFDEKTSSPLEMYLADIFTVPLNLAGLPGIALPCGLDSSSLPIGLQLIGKPFAELELLQAASELSRELGFDVDSRTLIH